MAIPRIEGEEITFYRYEGRTRGLVPNQFGILEPDPQWLPVEPRHLVDLHHEEEDHDPVFHHPAPDRSSTARLVRPFRHCR